MTKTTKEDIEMYKIKAWSDAIAKIATTLIRISGYVLIVYFVHLMVVSLAGKVTFADININLMANIFIKFVKEIAARGMYIIDILSILVGVGGVIYDIKQSKLRKDTIERLQGRNTELEHKIDPKRSSSRLTIRGETREGDK